MVEVAAAADTIWTPAVVGVLIASFFTGLIGLVTAVGGIWLQFRNREAGKKHGEQQDAQLTHIITLVDGTRSQLLNEIADLRDAKAVASGLPADRTVADDARKRSDEQEARVIAAAATAERSSEGSRDTAKDSKE